MPKINQEEYEFLKALDDKWEWIARDNDTILWVYENEPSKYADCWDEYRGVCEVVVESDLFQFIQWEDEEPYNIQELLEEYEKEGEVTEARGVEWLKEEVYKMFPSHSEMYEHPDDITVLKVSLLNEVINLIDEQDKPEVLSQELPAIPKFVAEWFEENKENFESKLKSIIKYPPQYDEDVTDFTKWVSNPVNKPIQTLGNMFNGYEVEEKEQKYIVKLPLPEDRTNDFAVVDIYGDIWRDGEWPSHCSHCKMTEKEIKALPKGEAYFEHFAVKVEEME